jgi:hypothetical protein
MIHSTNKMTLQFERKYSTQGSGAPCHVSFGFFSKFYGIRLAELHIDPHLESTIRPKARGLHSIWNAIFRIAFSNRFLIKTTRALFKTFERSTHGRLGTTREDFKTTQSSVVVPSSLGMIRAFLRTFGLWNSMTLKDYSPRPPRLLEDILLDYKVLRGLSYGHPWAHCSGGYQDRLLNGPLGLLDLGFTTPDRVGHEAYGVLVLGQESRHVWIHVEYSWPCMTSTLLLNRLVTMPPRLYKARQGHLSHYLHHIVNTPNQSRATQHTGRRVLLTSQPEPI